MSILKGQVSSPSNFASFFIVRTHSSSVNFKLIHFLLWIKRSHQSPNFQTFGCSGINLLNSSCHFPNHKTIFPQTLHHSLVSWKTTPLYSFSSNIIYFFKRSPLKCKFLRLLSDRVKICQILYVSFETTSQFLLKFCIIILCHDT